MVTSKEIITWLMLVLVVLESGDDCTGAGVLEMLSSLLDVEELAKQAAEGSTSKPVDETYPLAPVEMEILMKMYRDCRTQQSGAMRTWCTGDTEAKNESYPLCPRGVQTHPCTGRVLQDNSSIDEGATAFLWPWHGLRCDAFTDPTTLTHMYGSYFSYYCFTYVTLITVCVEW
ncbi:unnamed protein product [Phytophthora lilii]|uniref:Unnamed protein product n=1 Tax=Phytophthora lilii TaxID=2077276 RepID=A0A9W6U9L1_9STRA|nr:unnamed protein product [Phytophthora lilii]